MNRLSGRGLAGWCAAVVLVAAAGVAWADTISIGSMKRDDVKIRGFDGTNLLYDGLAGTEQLEVKANTVIRVDGEPLLNDAEAAYARHDFDNATDQYLKALESTNVGWIKDWTAARLQLAASKTSRADAVVAGWIYALHKDPKTAAPPAPAADSPYLAAVITQVKGAVDSFHDDDTRVVLLEYLLKAQQAANDTDGMAQTAARLGRAAKRADAQTANAVDPGGIAVSQALVDLDRKNYQAALNRIQQNRQIITDPASQADALWVLAEAQNGLAGDTTDNAKLQDVALAYMRLVAQFPSSQNAPQALFEVAALHERMGDNATAMQVYTQVQQMLSDHPENPVAVKARQAHERLRSQVAAPSTPTAAH